MFLKGETGQNEVVLLLELSQEMSLNHPACSQPHAVLGFGHVCSCVGSMSGKDGKKCQQCPCRSALCSKHVLLCKCVFWAAIQLQPQSCQYSCPNDHCISSALAYALLLRLASYSCLRQEKCNQNTHSKQNSVGWELGIAVFHRSGLL